MLIYKVCFCLLQVCNHSILRGWSVWLFSTTTVPSATKNKPAFHSASAKLPATHCWPQLLYHVTQIYQDVSRVFESCSYSPLPLGFFYKSPLPKTSESPGIILQILPAAAHSWDTSRILKIIFSSIDCISCFFNAVHFTGSVENNQTLYECQFTHFLLALTKGIFKYSKTPNLSNN